MILNNHNIALRVFIIRPYTPNNITAFVYYSSSAPCSAALRFVKHSLDRDQLYVTLFPDVFFVTFWPGMMSITLIALASSALQRRVPHPHPARCQLQPSSTYAA
jgi:hypothetical protein